MSNSIVSSLGQTYQNIKTFVAANERTTPNDTVKTSFQRSENVNTWYVVYRWAQFVVHLFIYLASFFDFQRSWAPTYTAPYTVHRGAMFYAKWFLYLTHWGVVLNVFQAFLGAVIITLAFANPQTPNSIHGVPLELAKFYRYAFGVALNLSLWISVGFWSLVYSSLFFTTDFVTVSQHGLNTLVLLLDMFVVKFPYKLLTGVWTCALCTIYQQILLMHFMLGALDRYQDRPYLYEIQDWSNPFEASIVMCTAVLTVISLNFLLWGLNLVKMNFIQVHHTNTN